VSPEIRAAWPGSGRRGRLQDREATLDRRPRDEGGERTFKHLGRDDGSAQWLGPRTVGVGWGDLSHVFPDEDRIIYGVTPMVQLRLALDDALSDVPVQQDQSD